MHECGYAVDHSSIQLLGDLFCTTYREGLSQEQKSSGSSVEQLIADFKADIKQLRGDGAA